MTDTAIQITYSHSIKGFWGKTYADETMHFWLEGFSDEILSEQPRRFLEVLEKTMRHMKTSGNYCDSISVHFPSAFGAGNTAFRITYESDGKGNAGFNLLTWPNGARLATTKPETKKNIMKYAADFFSAQLIKNNAKTA